MLGLPILRVLPILRGFYGKCKVPFQAPWGFNRLPYDELLRGRITLEVVAWDHPGTSVPMLGGCRPRIPSF